MLSSLITNLVPNYYSISLLIFWSPSLIALFFLYTTFLFHLYPPRANQMVGVDICSINTFLKFLCSICKAENHCSFSKLNSSWEIILMKVFVTWPKTWEVFFATPATTGCKEMMWLALSWIIVVSYKHNSPQYRKGEQY